MQSNEYGIKAFFRNFSDCLIENENKILSQRFKLYKLYCFTDSFGYFKYLDKNRKNYLDVSDFSVFLLNNKIKFTKSQLLRVIKLYDKDSDSCWNLGEYTSFISKDINLISSPVKEDEDNMNFAYDKVELYEKELADLFFLEINFLKLIGIKIKALKDVINSEKIDTKKIFHLIQPDNNKTNVDINTFMTFLNDDFYKIKKEDAERIIRLISLGKNYFTERQLDTIFKYDKYVTDNEITYHNLREYPRVNKSKNSFKEYIPTTSGALYQNVIHHEGKTKKNNFEMPQFVEKNKQKNKINSQINNSKALSSNSIKPNQTFNRNIEKDYYYTFLANNQKENNIFGSDMMPDNNPQDFDGHAFTWSQFSFK